MKKGKYLYIVVSIILISLSQFCDANNIHEDWIRQDSLFINQVKISFRTNPLSIGKNLKPWENARVNLGYGYSIIEHSMGKGYVSIFYTFVYKDKKLVSYVLRPQMPNDHKLIQRYLSFYKGIFEIENHRPKDLYFGYVKIAKPLNVVDTSLHLSKDLTFFMTPYSGVVYGDFGGDGNQILENREAFNIVKSSINEDILIYLLQSINPATRLCAAELYYSRNLAYKQKDLIEKLIERNFKELPEIETMSGCMKYREDARKVLNRMISKKK